MSDYVKLGAISNTKSVSQTTLDYLNELKPSIDHELQMILSNESIALNESKVLSEQTQIVAGVKYVVQIELADKTLAEVQFWKKPDGSLALLSTKVI